ncbi:MAG: hypothetical protein Fur0018_13230 [Anaerolineales bacterium]
MNILFPLSGDYPYMEYPSSWMGWLLWFGWVVGIAFVLWTGRRWQVRPKRRITLPVLLGLTLAASFMLGVRLPPWGGLPFPGRPVTARGPVLFALAALPWFWGAGMYGGSVAARLALVSGLVISLWDRHSIFFPLELTLIGGLTGTFLRQRYRTPFYRWMRHPLVAAALMGLLYPLAFIIDTLPLSNVDFVTRLDYAFSNTLTTWAGVAGMLLLAGAVTEGLRLSRQAGLGARPPWLPSPAERSLRLRFFYSMGIVLSALVVLLMAGDWIVSEHAARQSLESRMTGAAQIATERIPFFLETGQSLLLEWAQDARLLDSSVAPRQVLETDIRSVPFFTELILLDSRGNFLAAFPNDAYDLQNAPLEESMAVELALQGVVIQSYPIPPMAHDNAARMTFVAVVPGRNDTVGGVLIGRTDLSINPFLQPVLSAFEDVRSMGGDAFLLDENRQVLYHFSPLLTMTHYEWPLQEHISELTAPDGTRRLSLAQTAPGRPWTVALWVPLQRTQTLALQIAAPLLGMLLIFSLTMAFALRVVLQLVTASLRSLGEEANYIASGNLERPLEKGGEDEVGQLRSAFEEMRQSLKERLDELNRLLRVSQGVASTPHLKEALSPVLSAAIETGAQTARVVLLPTVLPDWDSEASMVPHVLTQGAAQKDYAYLDYQIVELARRQEQILLTNPARLSLLKFPPDAKVPGAVLAVALRHENAYYGVLWIAYEQPHAFSNDEIRFMATLAGQAALATSNARLFLHSEIERQRLGAILNSTPDPVLVTDYKNRFLLANPTARQVLQVEDEVLSGIPVEQLIHQPDLLALLRSSALEKQSAEVVLQDERVYLAIASPISMEGRQLGRVCVLRDITHFKELDALKTEFVSTVSHDLRSPLTLMRGYTTMLEMVGTLNEQQLSYLHKITKGIESMAQLVSNLLDLGRIEAGVGLLIEKVPSREIVDNVIDGLMLRAEHKQIRLQVVLPETPMPIIEADRALLQQALHNLVENAIKYTDPNGSVTVRAQVQDDHLLFSVEDTGIGIAPVDQARLFEKFYRVARRGHIQERGTGLGLAIVKSIAERHGGRVWVESQLGKGSTFHLLIPIHQQDGA